MTQVNMLEAKTNLSKLVESVETGKESEIILARNGKPVARIMPLAGSQGAPRKRVGIADGEFPDFDFAGFQALDKVVWGELYEDPVSSPSAQPKRAAAGKAAPGKRKVR